MTTLNIRWPSDNFRDLSDSPPKPMFLFPPALLTVVSLLPEPHSSWDIQYHDNELSCSLRWPNPPTSPVPATPPAKAAAYKPSSNASPPDSAYYSSSPASPDFDASFSSVELSPLVLPAFSPASQDFSCQASPPPAVMSSSSCQTTLQPSSSSVAVCCQTVVPVAAVSSSSSCQTDLQPPSSSISCQTTSSSPATSCQNICVSSTAGCSKLQNETSSTKELNIIPTNPSTADASCQHTPSLVSSSSSYCQTDCSKLQPDLPSLPQQNFINHWSTSFPPGTLKLLIPFFSNFLLGSDVINFSLDDFNYDLTASSHGLLGELLPEKLHNNFMDDLYTLLTSTNDVNDLHLDFYNLVKDEFDELESLAEFDEDDQILDQNCDFDHY